MPCIRAPGLTGTPAPVLQDIGPVIRWPRRDRGARHDPIPRRPRRRAGPRLGRGASGGTPRRHCPRRQDLGIPRAPTGAPGSNASIRRARAFNATVNRTKRPTARVTPTPCAARAPARRISAPGANGPRSPCAPSPRRRRAWCGPPPPGPGLAGGWPGIGQRALHDALNGPRADGSHSRGSGTSGSRTPRCVPATGLSVGPLLH